MCVIAIKGCCALAHTLCPVIIEQRRSVFDRLQIFAAAIVALEQPDLVFAAALERVRTTPHQMCVAGRARRTNDRSHVRNVSKDRVCRGHGENLGRETKHIIVAALVRHLAVVLNFFVIDRS